MKEDLQGVPASPSLPYGVPSADDGSGPSAAIPIAPSHNPSQR